MAGRVRSFSCRLANDGQSSGPATRRLSVGVRQLGITVHELTGYDEVRRDDFGKFFRQAA
jgi:hypothetical protein